MSVASPSFVEGGESFKSKNRKQKLPRQHNEKSLSVTTVFLGDFFSFCTFQKSDTSTLTFTVCDDACSDVWGSEGPQISAYLFGFLWELSRSLSGTVHIYCGTRDIGKRSSTEGGRHILLVNTLI